MVRSRDGTAALKGVLIVNNSTLLGLQSRFGDKLLGI